MKPGARGFALVEMLVACALGSLLAAAAVMLWQAGVQAQRAGEARALVQEQGQFALDLLARAIRQAGYRHALTLRQSLLRPPLPYAVLACAGRRFGDGQTATAWRWLPEAMPCAAPVAGNDADALVVLHEAGDPAGVLADGRAEWYQANTARQFDVTCQGNRLLQLGQRPGGLAERLPAGFDASVPLPADLQAVVAVAQNHYYVDTTPRPGLHGGRLMCAGVGITGELETPQPLVQGVEGLRLRFGLDLDDDGVVDTSRASAAMQAEDWARVAQVEICLLLRAETPVGGRASSDCDGRPLAAASALYQVLRGSVALRNPPGGGS